MKSKRDCHVALKCFNQDIGVPNEITLDGSKEQTGPKSSFVKQLHFCNTKIHRIEPYTPNQNFAETMIG